VPQAFDDPQFQVGYATRVSDHGACVSAASREAVMLRLLCRAGEAGASFGKDHFGVRGMHHLIGRTMEDNGAKVAVRALEMPLPLCRRC
jgi:hypothetical protein